MTRQISAGAVIFRREPSGEIKFLLLYHGRNYWNFPKGKLEGGERATSAFLREIEEETGLKRQDLKIISGFRATDRYMFFERPQRWGAAPRPVFKIVIFYLVESRKREVVVSREHDGFGWFTYREALRIAKFKNTRDILKQSYEFIQKNLPRTIPAHTGLARGLRRRPAHSQRPGGHLR